MANDVDILTKRGPGRPSKLSAPMGIPVQTRQSLEIERERLEQEAAALQERGIHLDDRLEKSRTRCKILLGEGLMKLAVSGSTYRDVCTEIIGQLKKPDDRELVSSWMPEEKCSPFTEPLAGTENEISKQTPKKSDRRVTPVINKASAATPPFSAAPQPNMPESHPGVAQEHLDLSSSSEQPIGARTDA